MNYLYEDKLLLSLSGHNFSYHAGQEADVEEKIAKYWIEAGIAEAVMPVQTKRTKTETE